MGDLSTYSVVDFIPVTRAVYLRLFVRLNEWIWPWHALALVAGAAAIWLAYRGNGRGVGVLSGLAWGAAGWVYHLEMYAPLNWAAVYFGWTFVFQGLLTAGTGLAGGLDRESASPTGWPDWIGLGAAAFALVGSPAIAPLTARGLSGTEWFGLAPDPTALAGLGLVLTADRLPWWLLPIPLLWAVVSLATSYGLGTVSGYATAAVALAASGAAAAKALELVRSSP